MRTLTKDEALDSAYTPSHKGYINCGFYTLVDILGEPTFKWYNCPINYEWAVEYKGNIFTIYDWRCAPDTSKTESKFQWNVGGSTWAEEFIEQIEKRRLLRIYREDVKWYSECARRGDLTEDEQLMYRRELANARLRRSELEKEIVV